MILIFLSTVFVKRLLHDSEQKNVYSLIVSKIDLTLTLLLWENNFLNRVVLFMKQVIYTFFSFCKQRQGQLLSSTTTYSIMSMAKTRGLK